MATGNTKTLQIFSSKKIEIARMTVTQVGPVNYANDLEQSYKIYLTATIPEVSTLANVEDIPSMFKAVKEAIHEEYDTQGCGHEYDCCGCYHGGAHDIKMVENKVTFFASYSRNY